MSNNKQHSDHFEELCAGYVLNTLDAEEREEFRTLLQNASEEERRLYEAMRSTATQLAFTTERAAPREAVLDRILTNITAEEIGDESKADKPGGMSRYVMAMAASFALLLITLALLFYSFNLNSQLENKQAKLEQLQNENDRMEELLSILEARTLDMVVMSGLEVNPDGYGKIIWDPQKKRALLQVSNLPPVPEGKDYQLWLIKNNKPIPSGVFAVHEPGKDTFFKIEELADATEQTANAFAITLEPKGGVKQPTGAMYLLGNVTQDKP